MGEDHRIDQAKTICDADGKQRGEPCEEICPEEDAADDRGVDAKAPGEPIGEEAVHDESAGKCIEGEECGKAEDNARDSCRPRSDFTRPLAASGCSASTAAVRRMKRAASTTPAAA